MRNMPTQNIIDELSAQDERDSEKLFGIDQKEKFDLTLPEGIYFKMSAEHYFALPYFSRSLAQKVNFSGEEAEFYIKNPTKETPAMALGTAIHSMFLEPEIFTETYTKAPSIADFPDKKIIQTVEDLKPYLEAFGLKKSGKKEDLIDSVREYLNPAEVVIWDDVKANFERENFISGRKVLSDEDFKTLSEMRKALTRYEELPAALENGRAEVVIIWKDKSTGVMCKCRLDYVQPEAIIDIKSYSIKDFNTPLFDQLCKKTIFSFYNLQYAIYAEALESAINAINEGRAAIHGEENEEWIKAFLKNPIKQFFILYARTQAPYQMQALGLKSAEFEGAGNNAYFAVAHNIWRGAIDKYANFLKTGKWHGEKEVETLRDQHVPNVLWQQPTLED